MAGDNGRQSGRSPGRNVFLLGMVSFFTDVSSEMIYPYVSIFLRDILLVAVAFVGLIEGIAESTASILKLCSGLVSDRFGKRKGLVAAGYALSTVGKPLLALAQTWWHVLGVRFIDRVGKGIRTAPRDALIADSTTAANRGFAFGLHRMMDTAGAVVGPLLAYLILSALDRGDEQGYRILFALALIPGLIALAFIPFVRDKRAGPVEAKQRPKLQLGLFDSNFRRFVFIIALFTLGNSSNVFLVLRATDLGVGLKDIALLWLVMNVVYAASAIPAGMLSDRIGRKKVLVGGCIAYGIVYLGFGFATAQWHIWALFAAYGLYNGASNGVSRPTLDNGGWLGGWTKFGNCTTRSRSKPSLTT